MSHRYHRLAGPRAIERCCEPQAKRKLCAKARGAVIGCTALAALASPALAGAAPTVRVDRPCYVEGQPVRVTGSGYTPNGDVSLFFTEQGPGNRTRLSPIGTKADGAGNIDDTTIKTPGEIAFPPHESVFLAA